MQETVKYVVPVELREADGVRTLHGVLLQEGRMASIRFEVFAPLSVIWPANGIKLLGEHRGTELARAVPTRDADGSLRIETPATPAILEAHEARKYFSVEFHAISESRTKGGTREILRALVDAAALVASPEYVQAVTEVRDRRRLKVWL